IGVDVDPWKRDLIRNGRTPIIEAGMDTLMAAAVASGRVQVTDDAASAVRGSELSFLCVGTPSRPNGSQDLRALERLAAQLGDTRTAEMLKYACNSFHALKITFANEIGRISQAAQVDPHAVMALLCDDKQLNISPAYLRPGFAFGGSCLPKDLRALCYLAGRQEVSTPMLSAIADSIRMYQAHAVQLVLASG